MNTISKTQLLDQLEREIEAGRTSWVSAGNALIRIRDERLWPEKYSTFWDYCEARWGWKKRNVNTVISSVESLSELGGQNFARLPAAQARELAKIEPEKRAEVLQKAAESGKVTAKSIKEAASVSGPSLPDDDETRDYKRTLKLKSFSDAALDWLASFNADRRDMIAAALHFKKLADDLERSAAQMEESK